MWISRSQSQLWTNGNLDHRSELKEKEYKKFVNREELCPFLSLYLTGASVQQFHAEQNPQSSAAKPF